MSGEGTGPIDNSRCAESNQPTSRKPDEGGAIQSAAPSRASDAGLPGDVITPSQVEHRSARPVVLFLAATALALGGAVAWMAQPSHCGTGCHRRAAVQRQIVVVPTPTPASE